MLFFKKGFFSIFSHISYVFRVDAINYSGTTRYLARTCVLDVLKKCILKSDLLREMCQKKVTKRDRNKLRFIYNKVFDD